MDEQAICYHLSLMKMHLNEIKRGSWKVPYADLPVYSSLYSKINELDKLLDQTSQDFASAVLRGAKHYE